MSKGVNAEECRQLLEAGRGKGTHPPTLVIRLLTSRTVRINLYCFKPLNACSFVSVAVINE